MYDIRKITKLVEEKIKGSKIFIVEIKVLGGNKISIFIDSNDGIKINDCVNISRYVESNLDRDKEDFELEVSSAGIGYPFKVENQYLKNLGEKVEILMNNGEKINGILKTYNKDFIELETTKKIKPEGKKKKQIITEIKNFKLINIKSTRLLLS